MNILLDTNALIWLLNSPDGKPLGPETVSLITNADAVYASAVSVLEIRIKAMLGKLQAPDALIKHIVAAGLKQLPLTMTHADAVTLSPSLSGHDPFGQMLLAQSQAEKFTFVTSDRTLLGQGFDWVKDARR